MFWKFISTAQGRILQSLLPLSLVYDGDFTFSDSNYKKFGMKNWFQTTEYILTTIYFLM